MTAACSAVFSRHWGPTFSMMSTDIPSIHLDILPSGWLWVDVTVSFLLSSKPKKKDNIMPDLNDSSDDTDDESLLLTEIY
jgi:hypothetical protein